jgi:hypothetical protein
MCSYAISLHLKKEYDMAAKVIGEYEKTQAGEPSQCRFASLSVLTPLSTSAKINPAKVLCGGVTWLRKVHVLGLCARAMRLHTGYVAAQGCVAA